MGWGKHSSLGPVPRQPRQGRMLKMLNPETLHYNRFLSQAGERNVGLRFVSAVAGQPVLVTGAGGYIGSALAMALAAAGPPG